MGLYFGYIPSWVRQQENPAFSMPRSLLDDFDEEFRLLLGLQDDGFVTIV